MFKPCGQVYLQGDRDLGQSPQGLELMGVFSMLNRSSPFAHRNGAGDSVQPRKARATFITRGS